MPTTAKKTSSAVVVPPAPTALHRERSSPKAVPAEEKKEQIVIKAPNFCRAEFVIRATPGVPLVIHRMTAKYREELLKGVLGGRSKNKSKDREIKPQNPQELCDQARYVSRDGWDGFHAASIRNAMIRACSLDGFKMVLAKLSVFVEADGWDAQEPQIPLIRIRDCKPILQQDVGRTSTGAPILIFRPAYHGWMAKLRIRWDADQFSTTDLYNLLMRAGLQVGIGEGRPSSPNSTGMGWGTFEIEKVAK